jgi:hypothetical protein
MRAAIETIRNGDIKLNLEEIEELLKNNEREYTIPYKINGDTDFLGVMELKWSALMLKRAKAKNISVKKAGTYLVNRDGVLEAIRNNDIETLNKIINEDD